MSELKATTVYDAYWKANSTGEGTGILVYLKSEADRYIGELESMLQDACLERDDNQTAIDELVNELRHQKQKRCLAMAKWCEFYADSLRVKRNQCRYDEAELAETYYIRCRRYRRWCQVWLELAEKFKEAN